MDTATYTQDQNYELLRLAPETAYTAWFRMLGSLGNINQIRSPEQHNRIMRTLFDIWKMLCRVEKHLILFFFCKSIFLIRFTFYRKILCMVTYILTVHRY